MAPKSDDRKSKASKAPPRRQPDGPAATAPAARKPDAQAKLREAEARAGHERGWSFTPLRGADGKKPYLKEWPTLPRETLEQALKWARAGNIGLRCGPASGITVIDEDEPGAAAELDLPPTVTAITGSGKKHFYYHHPGEPLPNWVEEVAPNIDIRDQGGQVVYVGSVNPQTGGVYRWAEGLSPAEIDVAPFPASLLERIHELQRARETGGRERAAPPPSRPPGAATSGGVSSGVKLGRSMKYAHAALEGEAAKVASAPDGQRNDTLNKAAFALGQLVGAGHLERGEVEASLYAAAQAAGLETDANCGPKQIRDTIRSGIESGAKEPRQIPERRTAGDGKAPSTGPGPRHASEPKATPKAQGYVLIPGPHHTDADTDQYIEISNDDFAAKVLRNLPPDAIYQKSGVPGELVGLPGRRKFKELSNDRMRLLVDQHVNLGKWVQKRDADPVLVYVNCSRDHAGLLLARAAIDPAVRELRILTPYPIYVRDVEASGGASGAEDFRRAEPGWHEGVYYDEPADLVGLEPETDAEVIRTVLEDLVIDFPFKDEASRHNFFGLLLTPIVRPALDDNTPLHLVLAPVERTGKSKLIEQVMGGVITGQKTPSVQLTESEEEQDKRILALLMRGDSLIHLDNLSDLDSSVIASLLTSRTYQGRRLGASQMLDLENNLTVAGSGNNVRASGEIAKRTVPINLEPATGDPENRTDFQHPDLNAYVASVRKDVLACLLGAVEIWKASGSPPGTRPLGGFERWAATVGGVLGVVGCNGWMGNRKVWVRVADQVGEDLRALVDHWAGAYETNFVTARDLVGIATTYSIFLETLTPPTEPGRLMSFTRRVLSPNVDRVVGQWVIRRHGYGNSSRYALAQVGN